MAVVFLDASMKDRFLERIGKLEENSARQWGTMEPIQMLAHLRRSAQISLGEIEVKDESTFIVKYCLGPLAFSGLVPWPKGKLKTLPVFLPAPEGDFAQEKDALLEEVSRFVEASEREPQRETIHPAFGPRTLEYWRRLHGMHFDHHLRQFGL